VAIDLLDHFRRKVMGPKLQKHILLDMIVSWLWPYRTNLRAFIVINTVIVLCITLNTKNMLLHTTTVFLKHKIRFNVSRHIGTMNCASSLRNDKHRWHLQVT